MSHLQGTHADTGNKHLILGFVINQKKSYVPLAMQAYLNHGYITHLAKLRQARLCNKHCYLVEMWVHRRMELEHSSMPGA
jgi:S-adenosylmethionine synthetase